MPLFPHPSHRPGAFHELALLRDRTCAALLGVAWLLVALTEALTGVLTGALAPTACSMASAAAAAVATLAGHAWGSGRIPRRLLVLCLAGQLALLEATAPVLHDVSPALPALLMAAAAAALADPWAVRIAGAAGLGPLLRLPVPDGHGGAWLASLALLACGIALLGWLAGQLRRLAAGAATARAPMPPHFAPRFTTMPPRAAARPHMAGAAAEAMCMVIDRQAGAVRLGVLLPAEAAGCHTRIFAHAGPDGCRIGVSHETGRRA